MSQPPDRSTLPPIPAPAPTLAYAQPLSYSNPAGQFVPNGDQARRAIRLVQAVFLTEIFLLFPFGIIGTYFISLESIEAWDKVTALEIAFLATAGILSLGYGILYLLAGICFVMWLHRACWNARALGAAGLTITPGWAVAWWFIPIANLFMPYRACKELCLASLRLTAPASERPAWLPRWWACWIGCSIVGLLAQHVTDFSSALPLRLASTALHLAAVLLTLGAGLLCIRLIRTTESAQLTATAA